MTARSSHPQGPFPSVLQQQPSHVSACPWPSFAPHLPCHCRPHRRSRRRLSHHCHRQVSETSLGSHSDRRPMPPPSSFLPTSPLSFLHSFTLLLIDPYNFFCQQLSGKLHHVIHVDRCSSWLLCQCARSRRSSLSCGGGRAGGFLCMWHHPPRAASSKVVRSSTLELDCCWYVPTCFLCVLTVPSLLRGVLCLATTGKRRRAKKT